MPSQTEPQDVCSLFVDPARTFINSMGSTRRAVDILQEQALTPSRVESDFVAEAVFLCPGYTADDHEKAARLVHVAVHRYQDLRDALKKKSRGNLTKVYQQAFGQVGNRLEEITGDETAVLRYQIVWNRIASRPSTDKLLGSALLTQAVSEFEVLIARLVRAVLEANPDILRGDDTKFALRDLDSFETLDELRESVAEDVADRLLRKGFNEWMSWFGAKLKTDIPGVLIENLELTEVIQRRHLFVHNGGVVNSSYLTNIGGLSKPPNLGERLVASRAYLNRSIDLLEQAGLKIAAAAALKFAGGDERREVEELLDHTCYESLQREHFAVVADVAEWLIPLLIDDPARLRLRVNSWVARKALEGTSAITHAVEQWDTRSLDGRFNLVKLALLDDFDSALALAKTLLDQGALDEIEWRTWPVLGGLREYAQSTGADLPDTSRWQTSHSD